ncbi:MAG: hypothetical protein AB8B65_03940 [Kordia sp.]|uniref:hypothetical protein n=1 Tax=Kordia sp. TaxID=1965332 RepID=UPI00385F8B5F
MKKQNLKSLKLNKKSISSFNSSTVHGGSGACSIESVLICEEDDSAGSVAVTFISWCRPCR